MKRLALLLSFFATAAFAAETRDLIIVAGQSNAVGFNAKPTELPADAADKEVMFWFRVGDPPPDDYDSTSGHQWTQLGPQPKGTPGPKTMPRQYGNFAEAEGGFGPEIGCARTLIAKEHKPLAVVKAAFSGTSITEWNPQKPDAPGSCYKALIDETKAAVAAAKEKQITLRPRAFVWVQGESDASEKGAAAYPQEIADLVAAIRKELDAPELIALLGVNTHFGSDKNPFMPKIVEAQKIAASQMARCAYVDTASATIANSAHFDTKGTIDIGNRFAEALLQMEGKGSGK